MCLEKGSDFLLDVHVFFFENSFITSGHFPIPFVCLTNIREVVGVKRFSRRRAKRRVSWEQVVNRVNRVIFLINGLVVNGVAAPLPESSDGQRMVYAPGLSEIQRGMLERLVRWSWQFCRRLRGAAAALESGSIEGDYCGWSELGDDSCVGDGEEAVPRSSWVPVIAERLALPAVGEGATVCLLSVLPADIRETYSTESALLRSPAPVKQEVEVVRLCHRVARGQYGAVLTRLRDAGMVVFSRLPPLCVNGIFAVRKDDSSDRLIFDGRRLHLFFIDPPSVKLPTPADFVDLLVPRGENVVVGKVDVINMYHKFRVPEWLSRYFGLSEITAREVGLEGSHVVYPLCVSLPMGFSHAVYLAHTAHDHILQGPFSEIPSVVSASPVSLGTARFSYIDDHGLLSIVTNTEFAVETVRDSIHRLEEAGLKTHRGEKLVIPGERPTVSVLGMDFERCGLVVPSLSRIIKLQRETISLVTSLTPISGRRLRRVLGIWIWVLLINRQLLCLLTQDLFELSRLEVRELLPTHVRHQLQALVDALPLVRADLTIPVSPMIIASDASSSGAGVVCRPVCEEDWRLVFTHRYRRGFYSRLGDSTLEGLTFDHSLKRLFLELSEWKTVRSFRWNFDDHINVLEGHAVLAAVRFILDEGLSNIRVPIFVDSAVVLGAVAKGRSSCRRLNHILSRLAGMLCAGDLRVSWGWVNSDLNPADPASRL